MRELQRKLNTASATIRVPRRRVVRAGLRGLGRLLVAGLTRTQISGQEHFPPHGPLIVVGNHIATMEVVLMAVCTPWHVEMLGTGDIAPPPFMDLIARLYGYIPINRGNLDRQALMQALSILRQGGVLAVFPEGGIWDPGGMEAKRGVAWLSFHAQAPILPIGFGGIDGALHQTLRLRRPRLIMNVGEVLPPVTVPPGTPRRLALQEAAQRILGAIHDLIPAPYRQQHPALEEERFELRLLATDRGGRPVPVPRDLMITQVQALGKMFYRPAILRIFARDLHRPIEGLRNLDQSPPPEAILRGVEAMLAYVEQENPGFFTYRFGPREGVAMEEGLREMRDLARWAQAQGHKLTIQFIRRYRLAGDPTVHVETAPGEPQPW